MKDRSFQAEQQSSLGCPPVLLWRPLHTRLSLTNGCTHIALVRRAGHAFVPPEDEKISAEVARAHELVVRVVGFSCTGPVRPCSSYRLAYRNARAFSFPSLTDRMKAHKNSEGGTRQCTGTALHVSRVTLCCYDDLKLQLLCRNDRTSVYRDKPLSLRKKSRDETRSPPRGFFSESVFVESPAIAHC